MVVMRPALIRNRRLFLLLGKAHMLLSIAGHRAALRPSGSCAAELETEDSRNIRVSL